MGLGVTVAVSALTGVGLGTSFYMIGQKIKRHFVNTEPLRYAQNEVLGTASRASYGIMSNGLSGNGRTPTPQPTQELRVHPRLFNNNPPVGANSDVPTELLHNHKI